MCLFGVQYQRLIVSGELPCCKEEAATLAAIQLHVDEAWPEYGNDDDDDAMTNEPLHLASATGDYDNQTLLCDDNNVAPCSGNAGGAYNDTFLCSVVCLPSAVCRLSHVCLSHSCSLLISSDRFKCFWQVQYTCGAE